jgi:hypothetical protein
VTIVGTTVMRRRVITTSLCARCVSGRELVNAFVRVPLLLLLPSRRLMGKVLRNSAWCLHPR